MLIANVSLLEATELLSRIRWHESNGWASVRCVDKHKNEL